MVIAVLNVNPRNLDLSSGCWFRKTEFFALGYYRFYFKIYYHWPTNASKNKSWTERKSKLGEMKDRSSSTMNFYCGLLTH